MSSSPFKSEVPLPEDKLPFGRSRMRCRCSFAPQIGATGANHGADLCRNGRPARALSAKSRPGHSGLTRCRQPRRGGGLRRGGAARPWPARPLDGREGRLGGLKPSRVSNARLARPHVAKRLSESASPPVIEPAYANRGIPLSQSRTMPGLRIVGRKARGKARIADRQGRVPGAASPGPATSASSVGVGPEGEVARQRATRARAAGTGVAWKYEEAVRSLSHARVSASARTSRPSASVLLNLHRSSRLRATGGCGTGRSGTGHRVSLTAGSARSRTGAPWP